MLAAGGLLSCGTATSTSNPGTPNRPVAVVVGDSEETAEPIEVVPAPTEVIFSAKSPASLVARLAHSFQGTKVEAFLKDGAAELVRGALGDDVYDVLDLFAPVHVAVLSEELGDETTVAFSIGLKSDYSDAALHQTLVVLQGGATGAKLGTLDCGVQKQDVNSPRLACTNARQLSASIELSLSRLTQAAGTGAPDLSLELSRDMVKREIAEFIRNELDGDRDEFGKTQVRDLLNAVGGVSIDLTLVGSKLVLAGEVEITPSNQLLPTLMVGQAARKLPPDFAGLPTDTHFAVALSGIEPQSLRSLPALDELWRQFESELRDRHPDAASDLLVAELRKLMLTGGPLTIATGPPSRDQAALLTKGKRLQEQRLGLEGWWAVGFSEPLTHWTSTLNTLLTLNQRAFTQPKGRSPRPTLRSINQHPLARGAGLPKATLYLRAREARNPAYQLGSGQTPPLETTTHVYVTGDESTTWIVFSEHDELALSVARRVLIAEPSSSLQTHSRPSGVDSARLLGFFTPVGLVQPFLSAKTEYRVRRSKETLKQAREIQDDGFGAVAFRYQTRDGDQVKFAQVQVAWDVRLLEQAVAPFVSMALLGSMPLTDSDQPSD